VVAQVVIVLIVVMTCFEPMMICLNCCLIQ